MKRIVICYDGTWNALSKPEEVTNVVRVAQAIKSVSSNGVTQMVYYNAGVGNGGPIDRVLGGVFGAGLRDSVKRGLAFLALNWDPAEPGNPIAEAQKRIIAMQEGVYFGADTDAVNAPSDRYDGCHLSGTGARKLAKLWTQAIAAPVPGKPSER